MDVADQHLRRNDFRSSALGSLNHGDIIIVYLLTFSTFFGSRKADNGTNHAATTSLTSGPAGRKSGGSSTWRGSSTFNLNPLSPV